MCLTWIHTYHGAVIVKKENETKYWHIQKGVMGKGFMSILILISFKLVLQQEFKRNEKEPGV